MGDVMQSLTVFGIVGDTQPGLSSTARDSLGWSALRRIYYDDPPGFRASCCSAVSSHLTSDTRC
jgi:hypothetical protein